MEIITSLDNLNIDGKTAVALGNFDGLHIGHKLIMEDAVRTAHERGMKSLCFTFSNHPFNFILRRSDDDPDALKLICTESEKIELVRGMGFDILVNVPFDEHIMKMRAGDFFRDIIAGCLNAGYVSVGFNYTYGARAEGKPDMLVRACEESGIGVTIHDAVMAEGKVVSSTLIREMIAAGNMEAVALYLGRPYSFTGKIIHGNSLGRTRDIPTANFPAPQGRMLPPNGVYFSRTLIEDAEYASVSNIGMKPTVGSDTKTIETNIFELNEDLYGKDVTVVFDHFSRPERKFGSTDELFAQIARDCSDARSYYDGLLKK